MKISINFIAGECNGFFSFIIHCGNNHQKVNVVEGNNVITFDANHEELILEFSGKNNNEDTKVVDDVIVKDKFIDIQSIDIDGFNLERYHLYFHYFDPYISHNSIHKINLPNSNNVLYWYMEILEKHASIGQ